MTEYKTPDKHTTINLNFRDMAEYGIIPLTGEACNIGCRMLCDLTKFGREICCEAFGLKEEGFQENWNSHSNKGVHIASIMLSHDTLRQLAIIALFKRGATCVIEYETFVVGLYGTIEENREAVEYFKMYETEGNPFRRTYSPIGGPSVGTRSTHAATGRTE